MKSKRVIVAIPAFLLLLLWISSGVFAQTGNILSDSTLNKQVVIIKNDGTKFIGKIIEKNEREILVTENDLFGSFYIPLHEIRDIRNVTQRAMGGSSVFSTRYFLTTNGLGMEKGEKYALLNYFGPEIHSAVADDFTMGLMTTWAAIPLIGSMKYSFRFNDNFHMSIGTLLGTLSWINFSGAGILGYGSVTFGNYINNFTASFGYLGITYEGDSFNAPLLSFAALFKVGRGIQFVGDSFIYLGEQEKVAVIVPGLRFERPSRRSSIQVGIGGAVIDGEAVPVPIPIFSWFFDL